MKTMIFPQTGLPVGFSLRKKLNRLDTLLGALGLVGRGFGCAGRAGLGWAWGLAVLGALAGLGGVGRAMGWAWGLAVLGALAGLGVGFGRAGRAGWVGRVVDVRAHWMGWAWCWAWGLAVLGALAGLGVVLGAGFGRAGRASWVGRGVGRGVWPCWARWLGWAWGLAVLGALAGLGVVLGVRFGRAGRAGWVGRAGRPGWVGRGVGRAGRPGWVGRAVGRGVWPCLARWLGWAVCWAPGLAVLGALAGLGVVLGVGFGRTGRAGWVGHGFKVQKYILEIQK